MDSFSFLIADTKRYLIFAVSIAVGILFSVVFSLLSKKGVIRVKYTANLLSVCVFVFAGSIGLTLVFQLWLSSVLCAGDAMLMPIILKNDEEVENKPNWKTYLLCFACAAVGVALGAVLNAVLPRA